MRYTIKLYKPKGRDWPKRRWVVWDTQTDEWTIAGDSKAHTQEICKGFNEVEIQEADAQAKVIQVCFVTRRRVA